MKIGTLVGKTDKGEYMHLGQPGDLDPLIKLQTEIVDAKGIIKDGKKSIKIVKTWLSNVADGPLKMRRM